MWRVSELRSLDGAGLRETVKHGGALERLVGKGKAGKAWGEVVRSTIQRYYPAPKKRETSGFFLWSKVFLDKGITNRSIGQSLRVDFPESKTNLYNQQTKKRTGKTLIYWLHCCGGSIGYCEWVWIRHGSLRTTVPSTR